MSVGQVELGPRETSPARPILNRTSLLSPHPTYPYKFVAFCMCLPSSLRILIVKLY